MKGGWERATGGEWIECEWGDVATLEYGRALHGYRKAKGTFRVYGTNGPIGWHDTALCNHPGVIVGRKGAYRGIHYSPEPFFVIDTAFYIEPRQGFDYRWAYYALLACDINAMDSGSAIPSTSRDSFYRLPLRLPPMPEQRAIAHVLGALDDKIELNRRLNETLEAMARAVFKDWFVDFGPVRAKLEGREPYLPPEVWSLFPDRLVDSELGEIPEGWEVGSFSEIVTVLRDKENPVMSPEALFSHFSIPAYDDGQTPKQQLGESIKSSKSRVQPGVVLLSKLNPEIERVWLVDVASDERAICSTEFLVLQSRPPFQRSYVYCIARAPIFREQIKSLVTGTSKSHQRAQVRAILALPTPIPPAQVVRAFDRQVSAFLDRVLDHRRGTITLVTLRDALLPKLVAGEVQTGARSEHGS